jgi:hypothetical protein
VGDIMLSDDIGNAIEGFISLPEHLSQGGFNGCEG